MSRHLSNGVVARNLMIVIDTKNTCTALHADSLAAWIVQHVNRQWPVEMSYYPHGVVVGVQDRDCVMTDSGPFIDDVPPASRAVVAVHQSGGECGYVACSDYDDSAMIVTHERSSPPGILDPNILLDRLVGDQAPVDIEKLGVSGVSDKYAQELWAEIVSVERQWMNGRGGGYMVHPMWLYDADGGTRTVRETSATFGWGDDYIERVRHL